MIITIPSDDTCSSSAPRQEGPIETRGTTVGMHPSMNPLHHIMKTPLALHPDFMVYHIRSGAPRQQAHGPTQGSAFQQRPSSSCVHPSFRARAHFICRALQCCKAQSNTPQHPVMAPQDRSDLQHGATRWDPAPTWGERWQHQAGPACSRLHTPQCLNATGGEC